MGRRRFDHPKRQAEVGSVWELDTSRGYINVVVLVIGEFQPATGNYPCVVLDCADIWTTTRPGQRMNAAVTTAQGWVRVA
jgi:hypothetical protein